MHNIRPGRTIYIQASIQCIIFVLDEVYASQASLGRLIFVLDEYYASWTLHGCKMFVLDELNAFMPLLYAYCSS